jgi:FixJ family two-component response regulator
MIAAESPLVLVVDDDASSRKSLRRLLKVAGWEVEAFASGRDFLARPRPDRPSCLLLDVRMPGLTGPDLQDALTGVGERLSIVFLTGYGDVRMGVRAMKSGARRCAHEACFSVPSSGRWPSRFGTGGNRPGSKRSQVGAVI